MVWRATAYPGAGFPSAMRREGLFFGLTLALFRSAEPPLPGGEHIWGVRQAEKRPEGPFCIQRGTQCPLGSQTSSWGTATRFRGYSGAGSGRNSGREGRFLAVREDFGNMV